MYYDSLSVDGNTHKEKMIDNLFKKFDLDVIPIDPSEGMKIKAKFYWRGVPKFTTYEEAYNFFYNVSQTLNCRECILSNALSYTKDSTSRNKLLLKYINTDSIKYKKFAENLLKGIINKSLSEKKITAFDQLDIFIKQSYETIVIPDKQDLFTMIIDSVMKNKTDRTALYFPEFKKNHLNDYRDFKALENFSRVQIFSTGEKTELHILDPRYWEIFSRYNVNEIEFISSRYYETRGSEKTIDAYKKIMNIDPSIILTKNNQTKYLDLYITSIREIENSLMKIRYLSMNNKMNSKETNFEQINKMIKYELSIKAKRATELDQKYRYNLKFN